MGLQEILDEINRDTSDKTESIMNEARFSASEILMNKKEALELVYKKKNDEFLKSLERERKKLAAKTEFEIQKEKNRLKNNLALEILSETKETLIEIFRRDTDKYLSFLSAIIDKIGKVSGDEKIVVSLNAKDRELFDKLKKTAKSEIILSDSSARIFAGVICEFGNTVFDFSIGAIFDRMKPDFMRIIGLSLKF
jgi:vacuolar-type H+-ATPase subunit E/Vma4